MFEVDCKRKKHIIFLIKFIYHRVLDHPVLQKQKCDAALGQCFNNNIEICL